MSLVAGIDYSTHAVDVVWLDEDTGRAEWNRFGLEGADAFERTRDVAGHWKVPGRGWWLDRGVVAIGIEEPRGYNAGALYRIQGAILSRLPPEVLVQPWLPSEWRRRVGLPGNASKGNVDLFVKFLYPGALDRTEWPQDACDAYCIALATRNALQKEDAA